MSRVSVFIPCLVDLFLPEVGEAAFLLLRHIGLQPLYHKEQTCCGQPAINSGYVKQAKKAAKHFIEVFENDDTIVSPSGSCVHTVRHRYPELLQDEPSWLSRAEQLASRTYELSQYLVDILGMENVGAVSESRVAYHPSCQLLRGLGISDQPRKLIRAVKGTELVPMERETACCGFGGEFANDYPEISEAMVKQKVKHYIASGADILVTCDPGCLLNIGGYLSRHHPEKKIVHLATFLANALRNGEA
ncbi:MAG: (Fe-S)-binding protein [Candidatus Abyssobacteria bacterium SURF_17]|uniref:(Fe-S)-binding protein n=1 Tax=Candidatus Abyssobacteria bacterium SURF_17 TaxID=2093361 RepID=A0A419F4Y1_9BACT|nr:MAG: (Fe-S)-binding protein [Candidatus Abyssubacteria bacterium SURF_17]